ncbi:MAG: O-antigen ligase family protein [Clostridia bacterium]|nr:O-antigen ligase family protein [Clostridia bacterium]
MDSKLSFKNCNWDEKILLFALCSCFLPYYITILTFAFVLGYIIFKKGKFLSTIKNLQNIFFGIFVVITIYTALVFDNWLGIVISVTFFGIVLIMNFSSIICTNEFYIKLLIMLTRMSVLLSFAAFTETLIYSGITKIFRANAYCMNPNYLAGLMMVSILASAYLEMSRNASRIYCFTVAIINFVTLYLTGSMSTWVALFIGFSIMLLVMRHHITIGIIFMLCAIAILVLFNSPQLFPRLEEADATIIIRFDIIEKVIECIKEAPFFGRGFLSCWHLNIITEMTNNRLWHAHNLLLECLVSFGIIGTIPLSVAFIILFKKLSIAHRKSNDLFGVTSFVIALVIGALAHSMVDLTLMWIQNGLLAVILVGGGIGSALKLSNKK